MKIGILNTSILTAEGCYSLKNITLAEAKEIISNKEIDSAVGHDAAADILTKVLDREIPVNRQVFKQEVGQICLVFKLNGRTKEGEILNLAQIEEIGYKFQLLERIS